MAAPRPRCCLLLPLLPLPLLLPLLLLLLLLPLLPPPPCPPCDFLNLMMMIRSTPWAVARGGKAQSSELKKAF